MVVGNSDEVAGHASQALEFLNMAREYLAAGNLHQASEKGWGAAAHMAKAVALVQGWQYERHSQFHQVMNRARHLSGNSRLPFLHGRAEILRFNFYNLADTLDAEIIAEDLVSMAELLDALEPLTSCGNSAIREVAT